VQFAPDRDHVIVRAGVTVAVKLCVLLTSTVGAAGLTVTVTTFKVNVVVWVTGTPAPSTPLTVIV
jgi:hypothetical protein